MEGAFITFVLVTAVASMAQAYVERIYQEKGNE